MVWRLYVAACALERMGGAHGMIEISKSKAKVDLVAADVSRVGSDLTRMHSAVCSVGHMLHRRLEYRRPFSCSTVASCTAQRRSR